MVKILPKPANKRKGTFLFT